MSRSIKDLNEQFQPKVKQLLTEANSLTTPWKTFITDGYRSYEEQNRLYAKGRTTAGRIVTNAGAGYSWHNFGLSVDIAFQKDGKLSYANKHYDKIVPIARRLGLTWGGDWKKFKDRPHFEWHPGVTLAQARAGKRPKGDSMPPVSGITEDKFTKVRLERDKNWKLYKKEKEKLDTKAKEIERLRNEVKKLNEDIKRNVGPAKNEVKAYKEFVSNIAEKMGVEHKTQAVEAKIDELIETENVLDKARDQRDKAKQELAEYKRKVDNQVESIEEVHSNPPKTVKGVINDLKRLYVEDRKEVKMVKDRGFSVWYSGLPKEVRVLPYLILSALITAAVDYFTSLKVDNLIVMAVANIGLIFLKQAKTRLSQ